MLHFPAADQVRVLVAVVLAFLAQLLVYLSDVRLFKYLEHFLLGDVLDLLGCLPGYRLATHAEALLDAVPVDDGAI